MIDEVTIILRRTPLPRDAIIQASRLYESVHVSRLLAILLDRGGTGPTLAVRLVGRLDPAAARTLADALDRYVERERACGWAVDPDGRMPREDGELLSGLAHWLRGAGRAGCAVWAEVGAPVVPLAVLPPRESWRDAPDGVERTDDPRRQPPLRVVPHLDPVNLWDDDSAADEASDPATDLRTGLADDREDTTSPALHAGMPPGQGDEEIDEAGTVGTTASRVMPPWIKGGIWDS